MLSVFGRVISCAGVGFEGWGKKGPEGCRLPTLDLNENYWESIQGKQVIGLSPLVYHCSFGRKENYMALFLSLTKAHNTDIQLPHIYSTLVILFQNRIAQNTWQI